jgi:hypothetical protein
LCGLFAAIAVDAAVGADPEAVVVPAAIAVAAAVSVGVVADADAETGQAPQAVPRSHARQHQGR